MFPVFGGEIVECEQGLAILAFGLLLFAVNCFMNSYLTHDWGIEQFRKSQLVRAAGQPFMISPL